MGRIVRQDKMKWIGLFLLTLLLIICMLASLMFGNTNFMLTDIYKTLTSSNSKDVAHIIIWQERFPRMVIAVVTGASLAVAGVISQLLTRNPLGSPSVLGINSGSIFVIVVCVVLFKVSDLHILVYFAFLGALLAAFLVYLLGSLGRSSTSAIKLILAGIAANAMFVSFTQIILLMNQKGMSDVLFWMAGTISGRTLDMILAVLPYLLVSLVVTCFLGRSMNIYASGESIAKGLGQNVFIMKVTLLILMVVLAGGSLAVIGNVGFVGLIIPHLAKAIVGNGYPWLTPYSILLGSIFLLIADLSTRLIHPPAEIPLGVITAFIGAPFFIYVAFKGGRARE
ncbi:FecCD family ABC transporter permease [Peribacillus asahii]|uniref:Siderophore ABC transporter permease n=1 Tax=Peribacillus asahii TaxID=228899 RepID=A0A3T0KU99_9BACI|nr:iron ABC transporter permease [Peribacillus asahii]AZV43996.1 siderophore ABC transporter permease [Peribacillus asahii]USK83731.1 iron ABC transporter permease [Peribacillus asahii]